MSNTANRILRVKQAKVEYDLNKLSNHEIFLMSGSQDIQDSIANDDLNEVLAEYGYLAQEGE